MNNQHFATKEPHTCRTEPRTNIKEPHLGNAVHQQLHQRNTQQQPWKSPLTLSNLALTIWKHTPTAKNRSSAFVEITTDIKELTKYNKEIHTNTREPCTDTKEITNNKTVFANSERRLAKSLSLLTFNF